MVSTPDTIKVLSILTVLICLKFFVIILASGTKRKRAPEDGFQPIKEEKDSAYKQMDDAQNEDEAEQDDAQNESSPLVAKVEFTEEDRWRRIVQNDMENIPITIILLWVAVICNGDNVVNIILASTFLFARIGHSVRFVVHLFVYIHC